MMLSRGIGGAPGMKSIIVITIDGVAVAMAVALVGRTIRILRVAAHATHGPVQ